MDHDDVMLQYYYRYYQCYFCFGSYAHKVGIVLEHYLVFAP